MVKIVKIVCACGLSMGCVSPVISLKIVKNVIFFMAYGWGSGVYHGQNGENSETCENILSLWLGCGVCTPVEKVKNGFALWLVCGVCTPS